MTRMVDRKKVLLRIEPDLHERLLRFVGKEQARRGRNGNGQKSMNSVIETAIEIYLNEVEANA